MHTLALIPQVHSMIQKLGQFTDIQAALVVGGLSLQAQAATLRSHPEIVVATPVSEGWGVVSVRRRRQKVVGGAGRMEAPAAWLWLDGNFCGV